MKWIISTFPFDFGIVQVGVHCCAGAAAEVVGTAIWVPMDIVCQRMQVIWNAQRFPCAPYQAQCTHPPDQAQSMYAPPAEYQGLKFKRYNAKVCITAQADIWDSRHA